MSLEDSVKAIVISEYPLDSVIADSKQSKLARKGIMKYVEHEKPDVIFVDGLCSRIRVPEIYTKKVQDSKPLNSFMQKPFELASEFLKEVKQASPKSEIYYVLSDADEDNMRRLTKHTALKEKTQNEAMIEECKSEIKNMRDQVANEKKHKLEGWADRAKKLNKRLGGYQSKLKNIKNKSMLKMPNAESPAWADFKKRTSMDYINKLKELNPGVHVEMGNVSVTAKGYSFEYAHNFNKTSEKTTKSNTNRLIEYVDKLHMGRVPLPHFLLEGGHNAETFVHPYRHGKEDSYSLLCSAMVMEDQKIVKGILDGNFKPELFQGRSNKVESCQRQIKKTAAPAPGIVLVGRDKDGYFAKTYSMEHLANVGGEEIKLEDIEFETFNVFSDIHVGKGAVRYQKLESAIQKMIKEIEEKKKRGKSAPILLMLNESLQGRNYPGMPVETRRKTPKEMKKGLDDVVQGYKVIEKNGKKYIELGVVDKLEREAIYEIERNNEPSVSNQVKWYNELTTELIPLTLIYGQYDTAVVFTEGTHIKKTFGEFGLKEVDLQTMIYDGLDMILPTLKKIGEVKTNTSLDGIKGKIKKGSQLKFDLKLGDLVYKISAVHKPGSASPASNIPMRQVKRAITTSDDADMFFSAHLHTPYFFAIGRLDSNNISVFYKGATFNEYDDFGQDLGWSPAVVGYEQAIVPKKSKAKGMYEVRFITSDIL